MASLDVLPLLLCQPVPLHLVLLQDGQVGGEECLGTGLYELKASVLVRRVKIIKEYSTNATVYPPVLDSEVLVTPSLEGCIILWIMLVTG